jgi:hypothetical protein
VLAGFFIRGIKPLSRWNNLGKGGSGLLRAVGWIVAIGLLLWVGSRAPSALVATLEQALSASSAAPRGWSVNAWAVLPEAEDSSRLSQTAQQLAQTAGLHGALRVIRGLDYDKAWVTQTVAGVTTEAIVERLHSGAIYLVLDRAGSQGSVGLASAVYLLPRWIRQTAPGSVVHLAATLEGAAPGAPWTNRQRQAVVDKVLGAVGAKPVSPLNSDHLISVAAYTPRLTQSDQLGPQPVDFQVAITYNDTLRANEVYVGSPLITVPY